MANSSPERRSAKRTVLLVNSPGWFTETGASRTFEIETPPLGLLYMASSVRQHTDAFDVRIVDVGAERVSVDGLRGILHATRPWAVGIAAMTLQLQGALDVARLVRAYDPRVPIFLGGPHISSDEGFVGRHAELFDHGITGEAELTFPQSLQALLDGRSVPQLQKGSAPEDPNEIAFPDRTLIDQRRYLRPYSYLVTRKCPFTCSFCSLPAATGKPRSRTVDNLVDEIRADLPRSRGYLSFSDDTFTLNKKFVHAFCKRVVDEGLKLRWRCATRVDVLDEDLIVAMKRAGCEYIGFGLEAGNERIRQQVLGKGRFGNERIEEIVGLCRKHGVVPNAFFMLGNPGETEAHLEETADMIMRLPLGGVAISIPLPLPGSALYEMAEKDGIISPEVIDRFARKELGIGATGVYPTYLRDLPKELVLQHMNRIFRRFYLRPGVILGWLKKDLENPRDLGEDLRSVVYLLRRGGSRRRPFV